MPVHKCKHALSKWNQTAYIYNKEEITTTVNVASYNNHHINFTDSYCTCTSILVSYMHAAT